ncbi:hypothetical protein [Campylobacter sp. MG1]|uniref:hypothetical protein n=1 Tax=Campylobacter sp. MG1 TaxID=2976332 RepID=UPI00226C975C|nr:hypothetical protein [Campylobacter sp. MG1]
MSNTDNKIITNKEYSSILNQKPDMVDNTINEIRDGLNNPVIITETFMIANDILNDSMPPSTFWGSIYNIIDKQENLYDGINTIKNTISK